MDCGKLVSIWRYPVKSLRGESLQAAEVSLSGVEGDRAQALLIEAGHPRVGKTYRGKENNALHLVVDAASALELAADRGVNAKVVADDEHYFDDAPISIVVDRWLDEVSEGLGYALEPQRFRPNFYIAANFSFHLDEGAFTGRELFLGEVVLRARYPIERCVTTTYDQATGESDPEVLRFIAQHRSTWMGVYCDVLRAGAVRIGDSLAIAER